jgi:1-acyl-sn-glycerol-3-phosphate acyltransferase
MSTNPNFEDIRPYCDEEVPSVIERILQNDGFSRLLRYVYPDGSLNSIKENIHSVRTINDFQAKVAHPTMRKLVNETTTSVTVSGLENIDKSRAHLFLSNHRDIILDSALLNILLYEANLGTFETAIGSNLLTEELVRDLTKLNKNFTVKRDATAREFYENSLQLSAYIHHTITQRNESVWIAQKEGRTKDGIDKTQPGLLKMLSMKSEGPMREWFKELNVTPVAISYEYDPCDFLKIPELVALSKEEKYEKAPDEDYRSILTGLTGQKGRVHISIGKPLDSELQALAAIASPNDKLKLLGELIDEKIYAQYRLWPSNYIAFDLLNGLNPKEGNYSDEEKSFFISRMESQLKQVSVEHDVAQKFLLGMYGNPVKNFKSLSTESLP